MLSNLHCNSVLKIKKKQKQTNKQKTTHMFLNPGIYRFIGLALKDNFFSMKGFRSDEHAVNSNNASDHA